MQKDFSVKEIVKIEKARRLIEKIKTENNISYDQIFENKLNVPIDVFTKELTTLQSVVKYLKENLGLSLHEISMFIGRDEKNIWHIYNKTNNMMKKKILVKDSNLEIPVSIFRNEKLSAQESLISYLKENLGLSYVHISRLIQRDNRVVSTVYLRGKKK